MWCGSGWNILYIHMDTKQQAKIICYWQRSVNHLVIYYIRNCTEILWVHFCFIMFKECTSTIQNLVHAPSKDKYTPLILKKCSWKLQNPWLTATYFWIYICIIIINWMLIPHLFTLIGLLLYIMASIYVYQSACQ
jgi:hypothetical protein